MMQSSKSSNQSSSASEHHSISTNHTDRSSSPFLSEYEYVGRLVTRERPIIRMSNSLHEKLLFPSNTNKYDYSTSSDEDVYDLSKPLSVIRINDRHVREIYRLPTPPPQIKRVFHRLRLPEPKIIERIFVHRPPREIIENILEIPPKKVHIINREKHLRKSKPIVRTKVVHLKSHHHHRHQSEQQQTTTSLYSPQLNPHPVGYTQSTISPSNLIHSHQLFNPQATYFTYGSQPIPPHYSSGYSRY